MDVWDAVSSVERNVYQGRFFGALQGALKFFVWLLTSKKTFLFFRLEKANNNMKP